MRLFRVKKGGKEYFVKASDAGSAAKQIKSIKDDDSTLTEVQGAIVALQQVMGYSKDKDDPVAHDMLIEGIDKAIAQLEKAKNKLK